MRRGCAAESSSCSHGGLDLPSNFLNDLTDKCSSLAQTSFHARDAGLQLARCSLVAFVQANGEARALLDCHDRGAGKRTSAETTFIKV